jgi:hypothetical protein
MRRLYSPAFVAEYLGLASASVYVFLNEPSNKFPKPDVVLIGPKGKNVGQGWTSDSLLLMRPWYESRRNLTPHAAKRRWAQVDAKRAEVATRDGLGEPYTPKPKTLSIPDRPKKTTTPPEGQGDA